MLMCAEFFLAWNSQVAEYGEGKEIVGVIRGSIKTVTRGKKPFNELPIYAKVAYILGLRVSPNHRYFLFTFILHCIKKERVHIFSVQFWVFRTWESFLLSEIHEKSTELEMGLLSSFEIFLISFRQCARKERKEYKYSEETCFTGWGKGPISSSFHKKVVFCEKADWGKGHLSFPWGAFTKVVPPSMGLVPKGFFLLVDTLSQQLKWMLIAGSSSPRSWHGSHVSPTCVPGICKACLESRSSGEMHSWGSGTSPWNADRFIEYLQILSQ